MVDEDNRLIIVLLIRFKAILDQSDLKIKKTNDKNIEYFTLKI
jgi:hypothetical protein